MKYLVTKKSLVLLALIVMAFALPAFSTNYALEIIIGLLLTVYMANGWNILAGLCGQLAFGHALFIGIGAYTSTILLLNLGISPWLGMIAGIGLSAISAAFIGYLSFRFGLSHIHFALVTYAFAQLAYWIAGQLNITGGSIGLVLPARANDFLMLNFASTSSFYYMILLMLILSMVLYYWLEKVKLGYYCKAIRDNEYAAQGLGVNLLKYKTLVMIISAILVTPGGVFFARFNQFIDPGSVLGFDISFRMLVGTVIGGLGNLWGPFIGGGVYTAITQVSRMIFGASMAGFDQ
ncbi:branched-chain amino acid ABC transporter permease, partial [Chloroflexota bacterium]